MPLLKDKLLGNAERQRMFVKRQKALDRTGGKMWATKAERGLLESILAFIREYDFTKNRFNSDLAKHIDKHVKADHDLLDRIRRWEK